MGALSKNIPTTAISLTMFQVVLTEAGIEYSKEKVFQAATPNSAQLVTMKQSMSLGANS